MFTRTITGNLAADPEVVPAGSIRITKFRVIENTGQYRSGAWQADETPTTHFVEARFELGENVAATLHRGDPVVVVGREHTDSWGEPDALHYGRVLEPDALHYGRVLEADVVGPDLNRAVADVHRTRATDTVGVTE